MKMSNAMLAFVPTSLRPLASKASRRLAPALETVPGVYAHDAANLRAEMLDTEAGRSPDENVTCG